jgi:hypothetical protein
MRRIALNSVLAMGLIVVMAAPHTMLAQYPAPPPCVVEIETYGYPVTQDCQMWLNNLYAQFPWAAAAIYALLGTH